MIAPSGDIESQAAFGERVRNQYADLITRLAEFERHLELARAAGSELGWPEDEIGLRDKSYHNGYAGTQQFSV